MRGSPAIYLLAVALATVSIISLAAPKAKVHHPPATIATQCSPQAATNAGRSKIPDKDAEEKTAEATVSLAFYTEILAFFTFVLAAVSAIEIYYLFRADKAARDSAKAATDTAESFPRIERAYVLIETASFSANAGKMSAEYTIKNFGKTPAIVTATEAKFCTTALPATPAYPPDDGRTYIALASGEKRIITGISISNEPLPLFLYGFIFYQDIFKKSHTTRFCFVVGEGSYQPRSGGEIYNSYD